MHSRNLGRAARLVAHKQAPTATCRRGSRRVVATRACVACRTWLVRRRGPEVLAGLQVDIAIAPYVQPPLHAGEVASAGFLHIPGQQFQLAGYCRASWDTACSCCAAHTTTTALAGHMHDPPSCSARPCMSHVTDNLFRGDLDDVTQMDRVERARRELRAQSLHGPNPGQPMPVAQMMADACIALRSLSTSSVTSILREWRIWPAGSDWCTGITLYSAHVTIGTPRVFFSCPHENFVPTPFLANAYDASSRIPAF